jgi:acetyltransferase EpsM
MMKKLIIFGAGRHALVVKDCIPANRYELIGHIDDFAAAGATCDGKPVFGPVSMLGALANEHGPLCGVIAIGANYLRRDIAVRAAAVLPGIEWVTIIHPSAIISQHARIGAGSTIVAGSIINCHARIGSHVLINTGSRIDHDSQFDDFSSTGPAVATGGGVMVGTCSHIGIGAVLSHGVTVGAHTVIGGQSYVNRDAESHSIYYGSPARKIRDRTEDQAYL